MMFTRHVSRRLAAYHDGQLTPPVLRKTDLHLSQCARCRLEYDVVRLGMESLDRLPVAEAPDAIWTSIEAALPRYSANRAAAIGRWRFAFAAAAMLVLIAAASWMLMRPAGTRWDVVRIEGTPAVGANPIHGTARVGAGEWIETDSASSARVTVGSIGSVEVAPNTRLRLVSVRPGDHRFALARGMIRAQISAPPRLFFVDTPSGTAIDLGCEYTLNTDEDGLGMLHVTRGWVSFQWKGLESLVPAGAMCQTQPRMGPGIPYFEDAPEVLRLALDGFGFDKSGNDSLSVILGAARARDTLSLWHLLWRVERGDRERIYHRMAELTPVPAGVSREKALALDPDTLNHWKDELAWTW